MTENQSDKNINVDGGIQGVAGENRGTVNQNNTFNTHNYYGQSEGQTLSQPPIEISPEELREAIVRNNSST